MTELLNVPECLSPRLKWLNEHNVQTIACLGVSVGDEDEFGNDMWPWYAWTNHTMPPFPSGQGPGMFNRGGATEHEAIVNLAIWQGWKLWNE